jgi:hypothetical protein
MDRRAFVSRLAFGLLAAPPAAEAQQGGKVARIGYLLQSPLAEKPSGLLGRDAERDAAASGAPSGAVICPGEGQAGRRRRAEARRKCPRNGYGRANPRSTGRSRTCAFGGRGGRRAGPGDGDARDRAGDPKIHEKLMREVEDFLRKQREGGTQG